MGLVKALESTDCGFATKGKSLTIDTIILTSIAQRRLEEASLDPGPTPRLLVSRTASFKRLGNDPGL